MEIKNKYYLDIRNPIQKIEPGPENWCGKNKKGDMIDFTNFYMRFNKKPFIIVAGEMHPTRTSEAYWEESILKMKSAGLNTISFYIIWNHIEKQPGVFDFSGNRNIRKFVKLCAKHEMFVWPRIGPFCNSEAAHGGLPSWLYGFPVKERSNDPNYLFFVERLFNAIGKAFNNLYFKDNGPIISLQIENEYGHAPAIWTVFYMYGCDIVSRGTDGEAHMSKLKEMAVNAGLIVPFYSCTGWGSSPVPENEFLPTGACYAYLHDSPPSNCSTFFIKPQQFQYPPAYSELGGGTPGQLRWRPIIPPESVEAGLFTRVACGGNMTGIYMFHGGTNPADYSRFYASNGDMSLMSYDFSAPIGEFGIIRKSYYHVRPLHQFLTDYGSCFASMAPVWQEKYVEPENTEDLRYMARINGDSGFLFINNYQDKLELPQRDHVKLVLETKTGSINLPEKGEITIAAGSMMIFPINMKIRGINLRSALVQPLCHIIHDNMTYYIFFAHDKIEPEYVFDECVKIESNSVEVFSENSVTFVKPKKLGFDNVFYVISKENKCAVLTLSKEQARRCIKGKFKGIERLFYSKNDLTFTNETITVTQIDNEKTSFGIFPASAEEFKNISNSKLSEEGVLTMVETSHNPRAIMANVQRFDEDKIMVHINDCEFEGLNDIYMKISYEGDCARVFGNGLTVADHFNNGTEWLISLKRFRNYVTTTGLYIRISPQIGAMNKSGFDGVTFQYALEEAESKAVFNYIEFIAEYKSLYS